MKVSRSLIVCITVVALTACGGGGGSGTSPGPSILLPPASGGAASKPAATVVPKYTIVDLGANFSPSAVNAHNLVVGSVTQSGTTRAFSYSAGVTHIYGVLPGDTVSAATDVNDSGVIVGYSTSPPAGNPSHAVEFTSASLIDLGGQAGQDINTANAVNNAGEIVGHSGSTSYAPDIPPACAGSTVIFDGHGGAQPITLPNGVGSTPAAVNDSGTIVGAQCVSPPADFAPFSYPVAAAFPTDACQLAPHPQSSASDVNDAGDITGDYTLLTSGSTCTAHGFLIKNGAVIDIPGVNGNASAGTGAAAVNASDWVVGSVTPQHAMLFVDGTTYDLNSLVTGQNCALWTLQAATDINDSKVIVGVGLLGNAEHGFMLIPQQ